jgi:ribulose kinase
VLDQPEASVLHLPALTAGVKAGQSAVGAVFAWLEHTRHSSMTVMYHGSFHLITTRLSVFE